MTNMDGTETLSLDRADPIEITVYLRSDTRSAARRRQQSMLERFEQLAEEGRIDDLGIRRWSSRITVPEDSTGDDDAVAAFERIERAARSADVHLDPFFRERTSADGGRVITLPVICAVVHGDDDLGGLYPCWNAGDHESVGDCLDALEAGDSIENLSG